MNFVRYVRSNQLLRHNAIFLVGSAAVGALNYLYNPILGRMLEPGVFGEVQTLVSLFLQIGVFLAVLSLVIVNIVANYEAGSSRDRFVFEFEKLALLVSFVLLVVVILFGKQLQAVLNFDSPWPFAALALAVVASVPFYIRGAFLRGHQQFGLVSSGNIVNAGAKLIFSALLVVAGLGTMGAIGGVVAAQVSACMLVAWWAFRAGLRSQGKARFFGWPDFALLAPELRYGGVVLAASLAITLQYSVDILVVKHFFDAHTAGLYAGVAAVARILFFLTASISQVLISKIKLGEQNSKSNESVLNKSLLMLLAISLPVLLVTVLFPTQVIGLLMGGEYTAMSGLLPMLSISVCIVAVINLLAAYYLALRRYGIALLTVVGAVFTYLFILLHHSSPMAVVESLLLGSAATLISVGVWNITERRYGV